MAKTHLLLAAFILSVTAHPACRFYQSTPEIAREHDDRDYYFLDGFVQIQGEAPLPPLEETVQVLDQAGNTKTVTRFRTLRERRDLCRTDAKRQADTKWLALTDRDWQPQSEWALRLRLGARGDWGECIDESFIRTHYYDDPESCRVVVLYPCHPQEY